MVVMMPFLMRAMCVADQVDFDSFDVDDEWVSDSFIPLRVSARMVVVVVHADLPADVVRVSSGEDSVCQVSFFPSYSFSLLRAAFACIS